MLARGTGVVPDGAVGEAMVLEHGKPPIRKADAAQLIDMPS